jgi:hypothetical protein
VSPSIAQPFLLVDPTPPSISLWPSRRALIDEYLAAIRRIRLADTLELIGLGVPIRAITLVCPAPMRIKLDTSGERYPPDPEGRPSSVLPVCAVEPDDLEIIETGDPEAAISAGSSVDILAFCWALRLGRAAVLGAVAPHYLEPEATPVHRDVGGCLCSGCSGIALLARDPCVRARILRQISHLNAKDLKHAAELQALQALPLPVHSIVTVEEVEIAAYRKRCGIRTLERVPFEVFLNMGQRGGDAAWSISATSGEMLIAPMMRRRYFQGETAVAQEKTQERASIPATRDLRAAPVPWLTRHEHLVLFPTPTGRSLKVDYMPHLMRGANRAAALPDDCTIRGLSHATGCWNLDRFAERGLGYRTLMRTG